MDRAEQDDIMVATAKLDASPVDNLAKVQFRRAMMLSAEACDEEDPVKQTKLSMRAVLAQTVAMAHFVSESPKVSYQIAEKAARAVVTVHVAECARRRGEIAGRAEAVEQAAADDVPWSVVLKRMAMKSPYALAAVLVALVLRGYGDKLIKLLFG